jgi:hypothetical protein
VRFWFGEFAMPSGVWLNRMDTLIDVNHLIPQLSKMMGFELPDIRANTRGTNQEVEWTREMCEWVDELDGPLWWELKANLR